MQFGSLYDGVASDFDTNEVLPIIFQLYFFSIYKKNSYYHLKLNLYMLPLNF